MSVELILLDGIQGGYRHPTFPGISFPRTRPSREYRFPGLLEKGRKRFSTWIRVLKRFRPFSSSPGKRYSREGRLWGNDIPGKAGCRYPPCMPYSRISSTDIGDPLLVLCCAYVQRHVECICISIWFHVPVMLKIIPRTSATNGASRVG